MSASRMDLIQRVVIQDPSLVLLMGASGAGKSTFARAHFQATEIISSDQCRALISDDETDQSVTLQAFSLVHFLADQRLTAYRLTVIDATSVRPEDRASLIALARKQHLNVYGIVFDLPEPVMLERHALRTDRKFGPGIIQRQRQLLHAGMGGLQHEGFTQLYLLRSEAEVQHTQVVRERLLPDKREERGPFDIIGDVHGCFEELCKLLEKLGYRIHSSPSDGHGPCFHVTHPEARRVIFLGDIIDRGPGIVPCLRLVMDMVLAGRAICLLGNHEAKLIRKLEGRDVKLKHGLEQTVEELAKTSPDFQARLLHFLEKLPAHALLDGGRLVVAHAGMKEHYIGRLGEKVRSFALFGDTTGEVDSYGLPVRNDWAQGYQGRALVVYGHTPTLEVRFVNNTVCVDTGCVFGGQLSALRYPEKELVSVRAAQVYFTPRRPLETTTPRPVAPWRLALEDTLHKEPLLVPMLSTPLVLSPSVMQPTLELLSRFCVDPRWLITLPPTMSPPDWSARPDWLERPEEAFAFYQVQKLEEVICQEKHQGLRCLMVVCEQPGVAVERFGLGTPSWGRMYTRLGRPILTSPELEQETLRRLSQGLKEAGIFEALSSSWVLLDGELVNWNRRRETVWGSALPHTLQAGLTGMGRGLELLAQAQARGVPVERLELSMRTRRQALESLEQVLRLRFPDGQEERVQLAPFHLLASEGAVHLDKTHVWHMEQLTMLCQVLPELCRPTRWWRVRLDDTQSLEDIIGWWEKASAWGEGGMIVKPIPFLPEAERGRMQPALKVRGREALRVSCGPEYTLPVTLERLKRRHVGGRRGLALREMALSVEALRRFVRREPLRRVHEVVSALLALKAESLDPRL